MVRIQKVILANDSKEIDKKKPEIMDASGTRIV
jgi:hypothetical protein